MPIAWIQRLEHQPCEHDEFSNRADPLGFVWKNREPLHANNAAIPMSSGAKVEPIIGKSNSDPKVIVLYPGCYTPILTQVI